MVKLHRTENVYAAFKICLLYNVLAAQLLITLCPDTANDHFMSWHS